MIVDRGATWNKWDLHVHTPLSIHHRYSGHGSDNWERFVLDLEKLPKEFKVIGVNDYYFINGYKKLLEEKRRGRLANIELFLPVVELRIDSFAGNNELKKINYHLIFSNELTPDEIEQHFISTLRIEYEVAPDNKFNEVLTEATLERLGAAIRGVTPQNKQAGLPSDKQLGFNNLTVKLDKIQDALSNHRFKGNYLIGLGKTEWDSVRWDGAAATKRDLISKAHFLFAASPNASAYETAKNKLKEQQVNTNLLDCSDAHSFSDNTSDKDRVGNCNTWIKAEVSFRGLKHTLHEFEDRVFVGEIPEKSQRIKRNPSYYLDSIQITKVPNTTFREKWFNQTIPLNPDLVSIIGNKGSGKSALADIIGLVGDTKNFTAFTFLEKLKFREPKNNPAQFFQATATWLNGSTEKKTLDKNSDPSNGEKIKYIPQNHLEELCNELSSDSESAFEKELKNVIFSHLEPAQRLGKETLDELLQYRSEQIERSIAMLLSDLREINSAVLLTEKKLREEFKSLHEKALKGKQDEIAAIDKSKPTEVQKPETDAKTSDNLKKVGSEIDDLAKTYNELTATIKAKTESKTLLVKRIAEVKKVLEKTQNLQAQFEKYLGDVRATLTDVGVDVEQVLSAKFDTSPIINKIAALTAELSEIDSYLAPDGDASLVVQTDRISQEIRKKRELLDVPNQAYQKYKTDLKEWEDRKAAISGDKDTEGTTKYHEAMLSAVKQAPVDLVNFERRRDDKSKEVYKKIGELVTVYKDLYRPVQDFIKSFDWSKDILALNFQVEVVNSGFEDGFFNYVNQGIKGSFCGQEPGKVLVNELLSKADLNDEEGALDFVHSVLHHLRADKRTDKNEVVDVEKQLKKGKNAVDLYNFLSGFEFLRPRYVLKIGNKELPQLSPGERGLLLLVFYLLVDRSSIPIVIDQPEGNLDNQTVKHLLVPAIKDAKKRRQVFLVTHNPNLAVVCDSEQIICATLDKPNQNEVIYECGAIENVEINKKIVDVLEGTWPAFDNRQKKYNRPTKATI